MWKKDINLEVINYTAIHILAKVVEKDGLVWFLTGLYGWPEASQIANSWALLTRLISFVGGPQLCIGDFNAILNSCEKLSRRSPYTSQMDNFRNALNQCQL